MLDHINFGLVYSCRYFDNLVGVYRKYFEQAWQLATKLKSDSNIDKDSISYIEFTYRK